MKHILLVFTGGTIGSQVSHGTIDTHADAGYQLLQLFTRRDPDHERIRFTCLQPLQILSENLHPLAWQQIIEAVESQDLSRFDGIIVTHGTDTLAYSAAALGIYFNGLNIPLLLVSSNFPLDYPLANGLNNFVCAVDYIRQGRQAGVFVPYQNPGHAMQVHIATRLSNCLPLSGDFISVQSRPYLNYENGLFTELHALPARQTAGIELKNRFAGILLIKPYPGLNYRNFALENVDAVLHELYHSGTACASEQWGKDHSLPAFCERCRQSGIGFYMAPALKSDAAYSSTQRMLAGGGKMIWNTSIESAYAKLGLAYANYDDLNMIDDFISRDVAWEQV
ncbi:asparaginase domain-containing protein [Methylomonas sp. SURF-2]|uniref:Asparaginase domain-containing protein n=1 Tax=Methylomonas subterranea TaxID=2952225 RepID=A0ABT1TEZ8_9GAMM|nr:asparaginase domain-containing protein [Methylomonas sp. SURF-2]MCQ8104039.1 asparaginase domain-containing protein [Methylomonas sp. SURF-2]